MSSLGGDSYGETTEEAAVVELACLEELVGLMEVVNDLTAVEEHVHRDLVEEGVEVVESLGEV